MVTNAKLYSIADVQFKEIDQLSTRMSELEDMMNARFEALHI